MRENNSNASRDRLGLQVIIAGLLALCVVTITLVVCYASVPDGDKSITSILGVITSPIVAIVTAFFGIKASSETASKAQDATQQAQQVALDTVQRSNESLNVLTTLNGRIDDLESFMTDAAKNKR